MKTEEWGIKTKQISDEGTEIEDWEISEVWNKYLKRELRMREWT
jgi:hypothetical protein